MKTITKEYTVYDFEDLKQNDELCEMIYQKFWIDNPNNINPWVDENINSFKKFAETLQMNFDYLLSNDEYETRQCYIKLSPSYDLDNKDYKYLLQNYKGNDYCFCDELQAFTNKLLSKKEYKVLCEWSTNDFVLEIQNKMFDMWFADNQDYFSKEIFLDYVESNRYEFDENGYLI
jgi:hypothetical protein